MSNPEDFDQTLQWSLLSTPSNQWLREHNNGIKSLGYEFEYEKFNKSKNRWDLIETIYK